MSKPRTEVFTPAEAAVLSRLSLKGVNNAIDKKTVAARRTKAGRLLDEQTVIYLALERRLSAAIAAAPKRRIVNVGALRVDMGEARHEVMERLKELRRAE